MKGSHRRGSDDWETLRQRIESVPGRQKAPGQQNPPVYGNESRLQQKAATGSQKDSDGPKKVHLSLNLTLPRVHLSRTQKKAGIMLAGLAVVGLAGFSAFKLIDKTNSNDTRDVLSDAVIEPEYDTVLPEGKKEETEGGKIGYDPQRKVASFKDTIGGVPVTVSQQPLPEPFKANPDEEIKKVAENFSATEVISEANPRIYLGNDVKGPQTVIFHKNDVLVFILSSQPIDNKQWVAYITELK